MSRPVRLSRRGGELLLRLLEQSRPVIIAPALQDFPPELPSELLKIGALENNNSKRTALALGDDEGPVFRDLSWQADRKAYGYFDASDGHVVVAPESQALYKVVLPWWLSWLAASVELTNSSKPTELVQTSAWDIGDLWITRRRNVPLLFGRRLHRDATFKALREALRKRAGRSGGLILTSSRHPVQQTIADPVFLVVPIADLVTNDSHEFAIDRSLLLSPYTATRSKISSTKPLDLSADGRRLTIHGGVTVHFKSDIHIKLIRALVAGYEEDNSRRARELLDDAGSSVTTLARAFGGEKWAQLKPYLRSKNRLWGFDL